MDVAPPFLGLQRGRFLVQMTVNEWSTVNDFVGDVEDDVDVVQNIVEVDVEVG